jgi:hypothetical protein
MGGIEVGSYHQNRLASYVIHSYRMRIPGKCYTVLLFNEAVLANKTVQNEDRLATEHQYATS